MWQAACNPQLPLGTLLSRSPFDSEDIYCELNQLYESYTMFWEADVDCTRHLEKSQHAELSLNNFNVLNCGEIDITLHLSFEPFLRGQPLAWSTLTWLCKPPHHPFPELF